MASNLTYNHVKQVQERYDALNAKIADGCFLTMDELQEGLCLAQYFDYAEDIVLWERWIVEEAANEKLYGPLEEEPVHAKLEQRHQVNWLQVGAVVLTAPCTFLSTWYVFPFLVRMFAYLISHIFLIARSGAPFACALGCAIIASITIAAVTSKRQ